ncbi:PREDICTED: uncharacterized protein LOC104997002 [Bison bison bison]|uniref:Uncharacterized protein LOC104997002 n=1 Tax=Bison bison bison TaxID=43346 RepID=A0A6P3I4Z5_BISBB|nr:PREDICTED: uncharacterized protein LOC104997002 [Bison bison bison]
MTTAVRRQPSWSRRTSGSHPCLGVKFCLGGLPRPVLLPRILSAPVATPRLPGPCGCGNATSSTASRYLEGGCPWTFWRRPALKMRPWHLVSANLRNLKIGYPLPNRTWESFLGAEPPHFRAQDLGVSASPWPDVQDTPEASIRVGYEVTLDMTHLLQLRDPLEEMLALVGPCCLRLSRVRDHMLPQAWAKLVTCELVTSSTTQAWPKPARGPIPPHSAIRAGLRAGPTDMLCIGAECHMVTKAEPYLGGGSGVDASGVKTTAWDVKEKIVLCGQASQMINTARWVSFQNNPQLGVFAEAMLPTGGGQQPEPSPG